MRDCQAGKQRRAVADWQGTEDIEQRIALARRIAAVCGFLHKRVMQRGRKRRWSFDTFDIFLQLRRR